MSEFTGDKQAAKEFIRDNVVAVEANGSRSLKVTCETASAANRAVGAYNVIYGGVTDVEFHFLGTDKYAYPRFENSTTRDNAMKYTAELMALKGSGPIDGSHQDLPDEDSVVEDTDTETDTDTTTWIVVGAAAAIIVLLLIWKPKGK